MEKISKAVSSDVQASFRELAKTAKQLNFVSDTLGRYVAIIEDALKSLKLGVAAWVTIESASSADGMVKTFRDLGYDKIGKHWCIALRAYDEAPWADEYLKYESWIFDEGPRWLRIKAIEFLPALIKELNDKAAAVSKHTSEKLPLASNLSNQISSLTADRKV